MKLDLERAPLDHQQANPPEQQPAEHALKTGIPAIEMFAGGVRDLVCPSAQHAPGSAAQGSSTEKSVPTKRSRRVR